MKTTKKSKPTEKKSKPTEEPIILPDADYDVEGTGSRYPRVTFRELGLVISKDGVDVPIATISGAILGHHIMRRLYSGAYGSPEATTVCYSSDGVRGVGDPGTTCATCPKSYFKVKAAGGTSWCKDYEACYLYDGKQILGVQVPVTSRQAFKQYLSTLKATGTHPASVITDIGVEPKVSKNGRKFGQAKFTKSAPLSRALLLQVSKLAVEVQQAPKQLAEPDPPDSVVNEWA